MCAREVPPSFGQHDHGNASNGNVAIVKQVTMCQPAAVITQQQAAQRES
jgi:hypothetical protein